jgi:uncharacterized protein (TIGR03032 family)
VSQVPTPGTPGTPGNAAIPGNAAPVGAPRDASAQSPLRSTHTTSLPDILRRAGASLVISTYQAGKLVIARADEGVLNTHFRAFQKPMGIAVKGNQRIALGSPPHVWDLWNVPDVAPKIEPKGKHDAYYVPRNIHTTGEIDIHEMAWIGDELWLVNTRFSCLCTLNQEHSFVPRWRPPFVSSYAPEDRCHLNGLGVRDNKPRYVTALGETDTPQGWRANKRDGGLLIDIEAGEIIADHLSMPHSPRWYDGRLWFLESGFGTLSVVDEASGRINVVAELPGFTRGLDFIGPLAFIGLSQVRETVSFGDIPITERLTERICGVWVVDTRNGQIVAFLRFEDSVQEIFAVQVLPGTRYPEVCIDDRDIIGSVYVLPDEALAEVKLTPVPNAPAPAPAPGSRAVPDAQAANQTM